MTTPNSVGSSTEIPVASVARPFGMLNERRLRLAKTQRTGIAQLSLVETALCALDPKISLRANYRHETGYYYTDQEKNRRFANVAITAPLGLTTHDEYFLFGLVALTFHQPQPSLEFLATPHYCLKKLGYFAGKGGKQYAEFRATIKRLAGVFYQNDAFYDPQLGTFQDAGFGFLKYSLPQRDDSSRAWRIVWDPLFFEYVKATGGKLFFDLTSKTFRDLDPASRRLALLLHKVFWRRKQSPHYELRHLGVQVLGFAPQRLTKYLKRDVAACARRLVDAGFLVLPAGITDSAGLFEKRGKGIYVVRFHRGPYFERTSIDELAHRPATDTLDSPLYDPLQAIGFEDAAIRAILKKYDYQDIARWAQVTQAAMESKGAKFFKVSPQAFCLDGIKRGGSAPDWYLEQQRDEERRHQDEELRARLRGDDDTARIGAYRSAKADARQAYVREQVTREHYRKTVETFLEMFAKGMPSDVARERAIATAEEHLTAGFRFPDYEEWSTAGQHSELPDRAT